METSTIRIALRDLNEHWDGSRVPAILEEIAAALREEADLPARVTANSVSISVEVSTTHLPAAAQVLRDIALI